MRFLWTVHRSVSLFRFRIFFGGNPWNLTPLQRPPRLHMVCLIPRKRNDLNEIKSQFRLSDINDEDDLCPTRPTPVSPSTGHLQVAHSWRSWKIPAPSAKSLGRVWELSLLNQLRSVQIFPWWETLLAFVQHAPLAYMSLLPRLGSAKPPEELDISKNIKISLNTQLISIAICYRMSLEKVDKGTGEDKASNSSVNLRTRMWFRTLQRCISSHCKDVFPHISKMYFLNIAKIYFLNL